MRDNAIRIHYGNERGMSVESEFFITNDPLTNEPRYWREYKATRGIDGKIREEVVPMEREEWFEAISRAANLAANFGHASTLNMDLTSYIRERRYRGA